MQQAKLNLELLNRLLKDNNSAIKQALELFVETTIDDMATLQKKINDRKFAEASKLAHSLKSRFVYLGNDDACEKVKLLEGLLKDGRDNTYNEITYLFNKLNSLISFCIGQVQEEIKTLQR